MAEYLGGNNCFLVVDLSVHLKDFLENLIHFVPQKKTTTTTTTQNHAKAKSMNQKTQIIHQAQVEDLK